MNTQELELKVKLYQKIWAVMSAVDYLKKDGEVKFGESYKYATEAAIKKEVHKALVENRLMFLPERSELVENVSETITDKYGKLKQQFRSTINLYFSFTDIDTGYSETKSMHGAGSGSDEKSLYKAFTGAFKYIFHLGLVIPTGDDPEKEDLSREEKKELKQQGQAAQKAVAERQVAEMQNGTHKPAWDWRVLASEFDALKVKVGGQYDNYLNTALGFFRLESLEQLPNEETARQIYKRILDAHKSALKANGKSAAPATQDVQPNWKETMQQKFTRAESLLGNAEYSNVLDRYGYLTFKDAANSDEANKLYRSLMDAAIAQGHDIRNGM